MTYLTDVAADSPVDWYQMETSTGTDSGSGGRTLTLSNVTTGVAGNYANGWSFNGSTSYASMSTYPGSGSVSALTYEAWIKAPSNAGMTSGDYHTIFRRNNTDVILLRVRGSTITGGSNAGKAEAYVAGTTLVSTGRVDDGNWHHIVLTVSGTSAKLYVDGGTAVTATTGKSTYNLGTGAAYIGSDSGTGEFFQGRLDNVAIYSTALSSTRVGVHYTSGSPIAGGYSPTPMTADAAWPGGVGVASVPGGYTATPMTATADVPGGLAARTQYVSVTEDDFENDSTGSGTGSETTIGLGSASSGQRGYFNLPAPTLATGETLLAARLILTSTVSRGDQTVQVARITQSWSQATLTYANRPTVTVIGTQTVNFALNTTFSVDVTSVVSTTNYGVRLAATSGSQPTSVASSENATSAYRPYIEYVIQPAPVTPGGYSAQPMTADAAMPTVTLGMDRTVTDSPMTASADMPNPTVVGSKVYTFNAEPMEAGAEAVEGAFSLPVTLSATAYEVDCMLNDAEVGTAEGVIYYPDPVTATASIVRPALVNGEVISINEADDAYFNRVFGLAPKVYQRLNDLGSTAVDRMATYNGTYHGVLVGQHNGPDGRHSVHFTQGSYLEQTEPTATNVDEASLQDGSALATTLEFSFRTAEANVFLMAGADQTITSQGVSSSYAARELFLSNGRLTFRSRIFAGTPDQIDKQFTGVRNLADNNWHHVVVKSGVYSRGEWATEIWIDGTFEIRRFGANGFVGFPDYIGFRPNIIDGSELETLPLSQGFVGDMTEVVFYNHNNLASHDIARNYYALMAWAPISPAPFEASATFAGGKGKGSQKKALYLYWDRNDEVFETGDALEYSISFDPMPGFVSLSGTIQPNPLEPVGDYFGYKVFAKSVRLKGDFTNYRDPLTDDPSLINLDTDVDLDDYDLIMFKDWPDEGKELDDIEANFPNQKERLVRQLRDANDKGIGLLVTNPRMAVDLGVIDRVEYVPSLKESKYSLAQGAALGLYDYGSAINFPWNIAASDGLTGGQFATGIGQPENLTDSYLDNKAFYYHDTNSNNRFRVRAVIDGLTDLPGWMIDEAVWHVDFDQYGWQGAAYKYLKRDSGLQIGDEYIFYGSEVIGAKWLDSVTNRYNRYAGTWATPPGHVKAGTIVTTFGAKHWVGKSQVDNPYRDYVTTIVLQPGDTLAGRPVGGRILVNFSEQTSYGLGVVVQETPAGSTGWPNGYPVETTAQREWDYSWTRTTLGTTPQDTQTVAVTMPDGSVQVIKVGTNSNLAMVRSGQLFPVSGKPRMEMTGRAMYWLGAFNKPQEGEVAVRATAMNATAAMPQPQVRGRKTNTVIAESMLATAAMPRVAEDHYGETNVLALPMTASATFSGYGKTITATPLLATAELVEVFDAVHAEGEQVALVLHNYEATLYLKEEA
jgi:hypothetical protein